MKLHRFDIPIGLWLLACCLVFQPVTNLASAAQAPQTIDSALRPDDGLPPAPTRPSVSEKTESAPTAETSPSPTTVVDNIPLSSEEPKTTPTSPAAEITGNDEIRTLSVAPGAKPLLPQDKPAWVGAPPDLSTSVHRLFVGSFPTAHEDDSDAALDEPLVAAVCGYIEEQVVQQPGAAAELGITAEFIRRNLLSTATAYNAVLETSNGPMFQKWVVVEIPAEQRNHFLGRYQELQQRNRLGALGLGLFGLLCMTGLANIGFRRRVRRLELAEAKAAQPGTFAVVHQPAVSSGTCCGKSSALTWVIVGLTIAAATGIVRIKRMRETATEEPHLSGNAVGIVQEELKSARDAITEVQSAKESIMAQESIAREFADRVRDRVERIKDGPRRIKAEITIESGSRSADSIEDR